MGRVVVSQVRVMLMIGHLRGESEAAEWFLYFVGITALEDWAVL